MNRMKKIILFYSLILMFLTSSHYWGCSKTREDRIKIKDYLQGQWVVAYSKYNDEPADSSNKEKPYLYIFKNDSLRTGPEKWINTIEKIP